jgi:hypothetical protein
LTTLQACVSKLKSLEAFPLHYGAEDLFRGSLQTTIHVADCSCIDVSLTVVSKKHFNDGMCQHKYRVSGLKWQ